MDEIMNYEEENMTNEIACVETEAEGSGISTGVAMAIGAGLVVATTAIVKGVKKLWAKHKAKKAEQKQPGEEHDFVEVTDEEIKNVTK